MHIDLVAVGQKMPEWVARGFAEYQGRLRGELTLSLVEIPLQKRSKNSQLSQLRAKESEKMMGQLAASDYVVALDIPGRQHSSEDLATRLKYWQGRARRLALVIGGPEGLSDQVKARCDEFWSLGPLTLPHPLVRIVVAEALYRAHTINLGHPYHRGD